MYSSSSCRVSRGTYFQYDMEVNCPTCGRCAEIKLLRSRDNPERLSYKCPQCGKFIMWVIQVDERDRVAHGNDANKMMMMMTIDQRRNIKRVVQDINGRVLVLIVVMITIIVMLGNR